MNTGKLIHLLTQDTKPQWSFTRILLFATTCGIMISGSAFFLGLGVRPDISQAMHSIRFLLKFALTGMLTIAATGAALRVGRPDGTLERWGWAIAAAPVLLICAVGIELAMVPEGVWMQRLVGHNSHFCLTLIPLFSAGPLFCLFVALRRGAPRAPRLAGVLAGLAASGIAATFYAANCSDDSPLFVATWYPIAISFVVVVGCFMGDRLLRW